VPSAEAERVLAAMGRRGGWHVDRLCEQTGLGAGPVASGLMELVLAGRVRQEGWGLYSPVDAELAPAAIEKAPCLDDELGSSGRAPIGARAPAAGSLAADCEEAPIGACDPPAECSVQDSQDAPIGACDPPAETAVAESAQAPIGACVPSADARQVLDAMSRGREWIIDELVYETGLDVQSVAVALVELQLAARIRMVALGVYAAVALP